MTQNKKDLAIVIAATGNVAYAVANLLIGIQKHSPNLNPDVIVFCMDFAQKDKDLINQIIPTKFIEYEFPVKDTSKFNNTAINVYTKMPYSKYECFRLVDEYKKVLWLDIDIVINKDITPLIKTDCKDGIALYAHPIALYCSFSGDLHSLYNKFPNVDFALKSYNTGVMLVQDNIKNNHEITDWCYEKTQELSEYLFLAEQGVVNLMTKEFNINVTDLDEIYNCHPNNKPAKNAVILHSYSKEKFWDFYPNKEWDENNRKWNEMGGTPFKGKRANWFQRRLRFMELYLEIVPNPIRQPRKFILFTWYEISKHITNFFKEFKIAN